MKQFKQLFRTSKVMSQNVPMVTHILSKLDDMLKLLFFLFFSEPVKNCFQYGECRDSLHIKGEIVSDEFVCLEMCQSEPECQWLTFFQTTNYCELLKNCQTLDEEVCPDCLTSQRECVPEDPVCFVEGECQGIVDIIKTSASAEECLQLCDSTFGCRWFTFYSTGSECILFKSCSTIDATCEACVSGERRCAEATSSTAASTSTTTTSSPKPKGF